MLEIFIYLQKQVNLERKTRHAVITHANTSNGIKISTFFGKSWGMMLNLSNAPLSHCFYVNVAARSGVKRFANRWGVKEKG